MKRYISLGLLIFLSLSAHRVELYNSEVIISDSLTLSGGEIFTENRILSRDEVKSIIFDEGSMSTTQSDFMGNVREILMQRNMLARRYRDFPGVVMLDKGINRLHSDGRRTYKYHFRGFILKESKRSWASFQKRFNPDMENIEIEMARVIKPDGRILNLDMNEVKVTKPTQGKVFFDKGKTISFSLPGVEVGDIVEYSFKEEIFNPWDKNIFSFRWMFSGSEPVLLSSVRLILPPDEVFNHKLQNVDSIFVDSTVTDTARIYNFRMTETIPPVEEPYMPAMGRIVPVLHVSNQEDWDYLYRWYADFQKERMIVTPEIQNLTDSLTQNAETDEEKTANLYHWVQKNVRYISIKGSASSGVSGHRAKVTLENGYGDCTDKAILFSTILKAAGIEAYPVYLHTHPSPGLQKDIPSFWGNHAIVEIFPENGEPYFLDPVSENSRYPSFAEMDHGVFAICAQKNMVDFITVPPPEDNQRNYGYTINLSEDGSAVISFKSHYNGSYETGIRSYWERLNPEEKRMQFQQMAKRSSPAAELIDYKLNNLEDISKPLVMEIKYRVPDFLKFAGDLLLLEIPEIADRHTRRELSLSTRELDIYYNTSEELVHNFKFIIPEDMELLESPAPLGITGEKWSYKASYSSSSDTLIFRDDWKRSDRVIPVELYNDYRNDNGEIMRFIKKPVILRRRGGQR